MTDTFLHTDRWRERHRPADKQTKGQIDKEREREIQRESNIVRHNIDRQTDREERQNRQTDI